MKCYSISDAIVFLAQEYGAENMPTSEETLRRAVRTERLRVQEEGAPGCRGYTITEKELRAYAEKRMERLRARSTPRKSGVIMSEAIPQEKPRLFPDLYRQYADGKITSSSYYRELFNEKMKWEQIMCGKQEQLAKLDTQRRVLKNDILSCQSAIDAYADGIAKYTP